MSAYKVANYTVYWKFPSATERASLVPDIHELGRVAWQLDDDSFYILIGLTPDWKNIGEDDIVRFTAESLGDVTIPSGYQHIVYEQFEVTGALNIEGKLIIL